MVFRVQSQTPRGSRTPTSAESIVFGFWMGHAGVFGLWRARVGVSDARNGFRVQNLNKNCEVKGLKGDAGSGFGVQGAEGPVHGLGFEMCSVIGPPALCKDTSANFRTQRFVLWY